MDFHKFNYIGSKYKLLDTLVNTIVDFTGEKMKGKTVGDLFSGTSICGYRFRREEARVVSNDLEYYAYVIGRAFIISSYNAEIETEIEKLNSLKPIEGLVYENYAPTKGRRKYFTDENAKKIDSARTYLEKNHERLGDNNYFYLLTCLLLASDRVANIASVYGAYLKQFKKSALKPLQINSLHVETKVNSNKVYNEDVNTLILKEKFDIVYLDPPYNARQYSKNYHVLNYIAEYSKETELKGVTGLLKESNISEFCRKREVINAFESVLKNVQTKYLFMSYNSESLVDKSTMETMMKKYGDVKTVEIEHKRFKSNSRGNQEKTVTEYIFCLKYL